MTNPRPRRRVVEGRRPIEAHERPNLRALGTALREHRVAVGSTQASLAVATGLSERTIRRIEHAERRTRRSTLDRLAAALCSGDPGAQEYLLQQFVHLAGPALAPESEFADRVSRRRERRSRRIARQFVTEHVVTYGETAFGTLEWHVHRTRTSRSGIRERRYTLLRGGDGRARRWPQETSSGESS